METCLFLTVITSAVLLSENVQAFCGNESLHADLTRAAIKSSDWMRQFYMDNATFIRPYRAGSMFLTLRISGHQPATLLAEFKNANSLSIERTLKDYLDNQNTTNGDLMKIPTGRLAYIVQAVTALCQDPEDFHGHNLFSALRQGVKLFNTVPTFRNYFQYSLAAMAFYNGGRAIPDKMVKELIRGAYRKYSSHSVDTNAMILVALSCVKNSSLSPEVDKTVTKLAKQLRCMQNQTTGAFGNQYSTALAVQALQATRVSKQTWHCEKAMRHILTYQDEKGSFGNILANVQVTPSLLGESFVSLRKLVCPTKAPTLALRKITVSVELVFNDSINPLRREPPVPVTVVEGATAYDILMQAQRQNPCYTATYKKYSFGRSITSICGVQTDFLKKLYWTILVNGSPAQFGVDGIKPKDGTLITFKYKKFF